VVVSHRASSQAACGLRAVSIISGEVRQLTTGDGSWAGDLEPAVSTDGRRLVFARVREIGVEDLFVLRLQDDMQPAGQPVQVTNLGIAGSVAWLPDSRSVIFSAGEYRATRHLWRALLPDTGPAMAERVAAFGEDSANVALARWQSGASRLVYNREISDENVWRLDLREGAPARPQLWVSSTRADYSPSYSPDGKRITFVSNRSASSEIWVCEADGSRPVMLTSFAGKLTANPKWSPDGRNLVFDSRAGGQPHIYVISANGGSARRLSDETGTQPSWSRDGQWIYYLPTRSGSLDIWKMPSTGGAAIRVTTGGGVYGIESPDGQYLYYASSLHPLPTTLWRVPVRGGAAIKILDNLERSLNFSVGSGGIYFAARDRADGPAYLAHYDLQRAVTKRLLAVERPLSFGLTVSPDGGSLLYSTVDRQEADLMLVENVR
jgi:Tol biopolymer transport system component